MWGQELTGLPLDIRVLLLKLFFPFVQRLLEILKFLLVLVLLLFGNLFFWGRLYGKTQNTHSDPLTHTDTLTHTPIRMNKRNGVRGGHLSNKHRRFFLIILKCVLDVSVWGGRLCTRFCPGSVSLNSKNDRTSWSSVGKKKRIRKLQCAILMLQATHQIRFKKICLQNLQKHFIEWYKLLIWWN